MRRRTLLAALPWLAGCTPVVLPMGPPVQRPADDGEFLVMADGARLPLRRWLPDGAPDAVMLGLHGFNEYARSFLADPAPAFVGANIALYGIDQRGFGAAPNRGYWPGVATLVADARAACRLLRLRHPGLPLILMGESMGGAVAMLAALDATAEAPVADRLVLLAPAVWGRNAMSGVARFFMDLAAVTIPAFPISGGMPGITPTNNLAALRRWSRDPLVIRGTRVDAAIGLVDLMDAAVAAAPRLGREGPPVLILYGGEDHLVPPGPTRAVLRTVAPAVTLGFYPAGHHQLMRDEDHAVITRDILAWLAAPGARLPSGAAEGGAAWRARDR